MTVPPMQAANKARHERLAYEDMRLFPGSVKSPGALELFQLLEVVLRYQDVTHFPADGAQSIIDAYDHAFPGQGYRAKVVDAWEFEKVIPYGDGMLKIFSEYPQSMTILGQKRSGKTVSAWVVIEYLFRQFGGKAEIHVYGDIDNITGALIEMAKLDDTPYEIKQLADAIIVHEPGDEGDPPEAPEGIKQIILDNELRVATLSKRATATENVQQNMAMYRQRHIGSGVWKIINVIREQSLESVLREVAEVNTIKAMYGKLKEKLLEKAPEAWEPVLRYVGQLGVEEAIVIFPLMSHGGGEGQEFFTFVKPSWLQRAEKMAVSNKLIVNADADVPLRVIREAYDIYKTTEVSSMGVADMVRTKYGYNRKHQWWLIQFKKMDPMFQPKKRGRKSANPGTGPTEIAEKRETEGD